MVIVSAVGAGLVIGYTVVYAVRTLKLGNRRGGWGLLLLTAGVAALTAYVLGFRS